MDARGLSMNFQGLWRVSEVTNLHGGAPELSIPFRFEKFLIDSQRGTEKGRLSRKEQQAMTIAR